jgi:hypothetical protein
MAHNGFQTPQGDLLLTLGGGPEWLSPSGRPLVICGTNLLVLKSHHHMLYDNPPSLTDVIFHWFHLFSSYVTSHNCCQSPTPFHSWLAPYCDFYLQSLATTSPIHIFQPPSPAISPPSGPLSIYYWITHLLSR